MSTLNAFSRARAKCLATDEKLSSLRIAAAVKYGSGWRDSWLSRGERAQLDKARAGRDKAFDAFFGLLEKLSPREWSAGVPSHWVATELSFEDATRPVSEPLSVVPPCAFGNNVPVR